MNSAAKYDPFRIMPFEGYINGATGRRESYMSLAHFYYSEQLRGVDENYRQYILNQSDPELFRVEVEGVWQTNGKEDQERAYRIFYAGIYMQALNNKDVYSGFLSNASNLCVTNCENDALIADALGQFISDIVNGNEGQRKVAFLGAGSTNEYMLSCMEAIFAKNSPHCIFAIQDEECQLPASQFAIASASALNLISGSDSDDEIANNIARKCTHVFRFIDGFANSRSEEIVTLLAEAGTQVRAIPKADS